MLPHQRLDAFRFFTTKEGQIRMTPSKVKDGNYIVIQSFMIKDLKLKGNELLTYAIIYGFSQNGEDKFTGSLQYIADWTNSTKQGIMKNLKSLVDKGLLEKTEVFKNGVKFVEYHTTDYTTMQQSLTGYATKFNGGMQQSLTPPMQQSLPNNISLNKLDNNINDNIVTPIPPKDNLVPFEETAFNQFWNEYPKKVNKKGCYTSFKRIKNLKTEMPLIMEALKNFKNSKQWQKDNGQYIPNPQTFINQERWKDQQPVTRDQQLNNIDMTGWGV